MGCGSSQVQPVLTHVNISNKQGSNETKLYETQNLKKAHTIIEVKPLVVKTLKKNSKQRRSDEEDKSLSTRDKNDLDNQFHFEIHDKWSQELKNIKNKINSLTDDELYFDTDFNYFTRPPNENMEETKDDVNTEIRWLRPHEMVPNPTLGLHKLNPDECKQGCLGDCWLIAAFAAVAKYPNLIENIFSVDQKLYGHNYKGFVKVKFWQYGKWIEVYIDDKLPTRHNNLIYGKCKTSSHFWVPLLEKAYAKFVGSYEKLAGGHSEQAIIDLTGALCVSFKPGLINSLPDRYRIEDEMEERHKLLGCAAIRFAKEKTQSEDDFDGHAFSIMSITKCKTSEGNLERIYTLRNPHGIAKEGNRILSKDPIWTKIDEKSKNNILYDGKEVLSWMNATHIMYYFHNLCLAYYTPGLNLNSNLFKFVNSWIGPVDNKLNASKYLKVPHYLLEIKTPNETQKVNVLTELMQEKTGINYFGISILLFSVRRLASNKNKLFIGNINYANIPNKTYTQHRQVNTMFNLLPGFYILVPSVSSMDKHLLKFLFRVFSYENINVEELEIEKSDNSKFYTKDGRFVRIVVLRCSICGDIIQGEYSYNEKFTYHKECHEKFDVCDGCNNKIEGQYYKMDDGFHYCNNCYDFYKKRITSAKEKFTH